MLHVLLLQYFCFIKFNVLAIAIKLFIMILYFKIRQEHIKEYFLLSLLQVMMYQAQKTMRSIVS